MDAKKLLPVGVQSFEILRNENFVYVDKTQWLYQLITQGRVYFLSRPRRFGKSLLISTLDAIFQNKKHLFEGLWIAQSDYVWENYPVIWLDMSAVTNTSPQSLEKSLLHHLEIIASQYGIQLKAHLSLSDAFQDLILQLSKDSKKVVVLIDEYDKPLIDQIHRPEIAIANREILKHFYGILKSQDENIRFVFLTGVSKFSKVSVFSGLNNLNDISLSTKYATLLGYTQQELEHYFASWLKTLAQRETLSQQELLIKVKHWYNGYQFSEANAQVYNPFSTLLLFEHQRFATHWYATGTPTFLINLIEQKHFDMVNVENLKMEEADFSVYEVDRLSVLPLLYQTGYLTIKAYQADQNYYMLGYPNWEVENAFLASLLTSFSKLEEPVQRNFIIEMVDALKTKSFEKFFELLKSFLASIPYELHMAGEKYYQNIFYFVFTLVGLRLGAEVHTNRGRIDAVMEWEDKVYIFELKMDQVAQVALNQIKEKGYAEKYQMQKKEIYLIGIHFNSAKRNIEDYLVEHLTR